MVPAAGTKIKKTPLSTARVRESDAADRSEDLPRRGKSSVPAKAQTRQTQKYYHFSLLNISDCLMISSSTNIGVCARTASAMLSEGRASITLLTPFAALRTIFA